MRAIAFMEIMGFINHSRPGHEPRPLTSTVIELDPHFNIIPFKGSRPMAHETYSLRSLHDLKNELLLKVGAWHACPGSYRGKLYKKIDGIDASHPAACDAFGEIKLEIGIVEFTLQLNPDWNPGVLTLGDEIVEQTQREQRDALITGLGQLKEALGLLIHRCRRYHDARGAHDAASQNKQRHH